MSCYLTLKRAKFEIPLDKAADAQRALAELHDSIVVSDIENPPLDEIFKDLAWPLKRTSTAWVMVIDHAPRKQGGWESELFEKAAPFVVDGSLIIAEGEDGQTVEWHFWRGGVHDEALEPDEPEGDSIRSVQLSIPATMLRPAFAHLESKLPKLLKRLKQPPSVTAVFDRLGWKTGRRSDGTLEVTRKLGSAPVFTASDARLLRALAGFIAPDSYVHGTNNVWQLVFENGRCERREKK